MNDPNAPLIDNFYMANADLSDVANCTFSIIDTIQAQRPSVQAMAIAAAFIKLTEAFNLDTSETFSYVSRMMERASEVGQSQFKATEEYLKLDLRRN